MLNFDVRTLRETSPVEAAARVGPGEVLSLIGRTGAGKSTLLRLLAGHEPCLGSLHLEGGDPGGSSGPTIDLLPLPPHRRGLAYVPQRPTALWPRATVAQSLDLVTRLARRPASTGPAPRDTRAMLFARLHLEGLATRRAGVLSGGELQRLALAQALVSRPAGLLLDEPLSQQDPAWRSGLTDALADAIRTLGIPAVWATHDLAEAQRVATTIVALDAGRVAWAGPPDELLSRPGTPRLARLVGYVAFLPCDDGTVVAVHPDRALLGRPGDTQKDGSVSVPGTVRGNRPFGGRRLVTVEPDRGDPFDIAVSLGQEIPGEGQRTLVSLIDPPRYQTDLWKELLE